MSNSDKATPTDVYTFVIFSAILLVMLAVLASSYGGNYYEVRHRDTLDTIADRFGISVSTLLEANRIRSQEDLYIGRLLYIPGPRRVPLGPEQKYANNWDTPPEFEREFHPKWYDEERCLLGCDDPENNRPDIFEENNKKQRFSYERRQHTVRPYETLSSIAQLYGTTVYEIAKINGIVDVNEIYIGDILIIPKRSSALSPPETLVW